MSILNTRLRNWENDVTPLSEAPPSAYDTFTAFGGDDLEILTMRLLSSSSPSGLFPLTNLLSSPPELGDLFTTRMGYTFQDANGDGFQAFAALTSLQSVPVPVPPTLVLFGLGLAGLGWSRRKKA